MGSRVGTCMWLLSPTEARHPSSCCGRVTSRPARSKTGPSPTCRAGPPSALSNCAPCCAATNCCPPPRRWKSSARCRTATCWPRSALRAASLDAVLPRRAPQRRRDLVPRFGHARIAARIHQQQRCACHGERRRRTGHSTWARPTGFAVDSPLEGAGFELPVPRIIMLAVRCGRECRARVPLTIFAADPLRLGRTSIAPLADSRRLTLRLAVGGSAARPAEPINHQRVCLVVS
jgi:hypothetical protein